MTGNRLRQIAVPADEVLMAIALIVGEHGECGFLNRMPTMRALWVANKERAAWLFDKEYDPESGPEPELVVPLMRHEKSRD